jgi:hypothetical protein
MGGFIVVAVLLLPHGLIGLPRSLRFGRRWQRAERGGD